MFRRLFVLFLTSWCATAYVTRYPSLVRRPRTWQRWEALRMNAFGKDDNDGLEEQFDAEEDYERKLATAQKAIAAAQEARQKLLRDSKRSIQQEAPMGSRAKLSKTDAGTLVVELPPTGVNANVLLNGAFSAAWFSAIVPATLSGGAPLLFMLPFWAAGGMVAKSAVVDPFVSSTLTIGQFAWSLESTYRGGVVLNKQEGPTQQLQGAQAEVAAVVNGVPQCELRLYASKGMTAMGRSLSQDELEYLANQVNDHLYALREQHPMLKDDDKNEDGLSSLM